MVKVDEVRKQVGVAVLCLASLVVPSASAYASEMESSASRSSQYGAKQQATAVFGGLGLAVVGTLGAVCVGTAYKNRNSSNNAEGE